MSTRIKSGELAPVEDRIRWLLLCRAALIVVVLVTAQVTAATVGHPWHWSGIALSWLGLNALSLPVARRGRRHARFVLNAGMLGDGVLLGAAWWATGALGGPVSSLVIMHAVAVTLLASFRTGVKIAVWHSITALVFLEAVAAGLLGPPAPVPQRQLWIYLVAMWATVLGTASFAAMNERELRRRRYDAEVLGDFGLAVAAAPEPSAVAVTLARFAREELLATRAAVLAYVHDGSTDGAVRGFGVVVDGAGEPAVHNLTGELRPGSTVGDAVSQRRTLLRSHLDPDTDPWLAEALSGAHDMVLVPFVLDNVVGALVMDIPTKGAVHRVERRAVNTAQQATAHAGVALERAVLTDRIRAASQTDGLTGVANRRRFDEVFTAELARAHGTGADLSLVMIDIDHFKSFNDTYGHQLGDEVLRLVAGAIREVCAEPHLTARYGGEEFAAVLVGTGAAGAVEIAERIRAAVGAIQTVTTVTASLGVATSPTHGGRSTELLAAAAAALYRAKEGGRDQVRVAEPRAAAVPDSTRPVARVH
jgi:diguanylate cyclase (GGDEF)-like protein